MVNIAQSPDEVVQLAAQRVARFVLEFEATDTGDGDVIRWLGKWHDGRLTKTELTCADLRILLAAVSREAISYRRSTGAGS